MRGNDEPKGHVLYPASVCIVQVYRRRVVVQCTEKHMACQSDSHKPRDRALAHVGLCSSTTIKRGAVDVRLSKYNTDAGRFIPLHITCGSKSCANGLTGCFDQTTAWLAQVRSAVHSSTRTVVVLVVRVGRGLMQSINASLGRVWICFSPLTCSRGRWLRRHVAGQSVAEFRHVACRG